MNDKKISSISSMPDILNQQFTLLSILYKERKYHLQKCIGIKGEKMYLSFFVYKISS